MINNSVIKNKNILSVIIAGMLLLATPPEIWPYGYYIILRWAVTGTALFVLWASYKLEKQAWTWIMGIIAILFNPIAPIYLDKEAWTIIDIVVAGLFLASIFQVKK
jgi:hypothetical protein